MDFAFDFLSILFFMLSLQRMKKTKGSKALSSNSDFFVSNFTCANHSSNDILLV